MLLRRRKLLWSLVKMLWSSRRTQPPVDCLWSLVSSFPRLSVNSDNIIFSYVILFLLFTYVRYMHETWSWHAYRFAIGFRWKNRCDRPRPRPSSVLSAATAKRVMFRGDKVEPSQRAAPVRLARHPMEEVGSSSAVTTRPRKYRTIA
jgi:zona occludens toxin (predicted ATPase)